MVCIGRPRDAGTGPELRTPGAAAQTRIVSKARIRLDSRKSVRSFKGIICVDISEFESYMPRHAVSSLRSGERAWFSPSREQTSPCRVDRGRGGSGCQAHGETPQTLNFGCGSHPGGSASSTTCGKFRSFMWPVISPLRRLMRAARSCYAFVSSLSRTTRSCSSLALLMRYSNSRPL